MVSVMAAGCLLHAMFWQTVLSDETTATMLLSAPTWRDLTGAWGASPVDAAGAILDIPFAAVFGRLAGVSAFALAGAALLIRWQTGAVQWRGELNRRATRAWMWWLLPGGWELLRVAAFVAGSAWLEARLLGLWLAVDAITLAGWLATLSGSQRTADTDPAPSSATADAVPDQSPGSGSTGGTVSDGYRVSRWLLSGMAAYVIAFVAMNWQLDRALLLPHGDSAMYEEHLWNVLHGKGFRSYLDQGLFLGEHIQVVHLLLIPVYVLWPSQMLMELCQSLALASTALPVFWITRRATGSVRCATLLGLTCLLYPPLQFLDIAIDLKTFRPEAFGIPLLLFLLDQLERGNRKAALVLGVLVLSVKEDYTLVLGPLGLWIAAGPWLDRWHPRRAATTDAIKTTDPAVPASPPAWSNRSCLITGLTVAAASVTYLLAVMKIVLPWFRSGETVHYVRYFAKFGDSLGEILTNMLTQPSLLWNELVTTGSFSYVLALLLPLAFLPLLSPSRLFVALPEIALLCLNDIVQSDPAPRHHFQAPAARRTGGWARAAAGTPAAAAGRARS